MKGILNAFDFLVTTIRTIWDFFISMINNLIMLFKYLGIAAKICYQAIDSLPTWLQAFGTATVLIALLYMILGRSSGGKS